MITPPTHVSLNAARDTTEAYKRLNASSAYCLALLATRISAINV